LEPEKMTVVREWLGKNASAATHMDATIEEML
jgi:hypothetical protein